MAIQVRPTRNWFLSNILRDIYHEERLKTLKLQSLEKGRVRNVFVLTHKIKYLEVAQLFKF